MVHHHLAQVNTRLCLLRLEPYLYCTLARTLAISFHCLERAIVDRYNQILKESKRNVVCAFW